MGHLIVAVIRNRAPGSSFGTDRRRPAVALHVVAAGHRCRDRGPVSGIQAAGPKSLSSVRW